MYLTATVTTADDNEVTWEFPRMEKYDFVTRAFKERYRKWAHEYINEEQYQLVWPDTCRYIARQVAKDGIKPVKVELVRHWSWIQPPEGHGDPSPEGESQYTFYSYDIKPGDLK